MNKYYILYEKNLKEKYINPKSQDLKNKILKISEKLIFDYNDFVTFMRENNNKNNFLFYFVNYIPSVLTNSIINYLKNIPTVKINIYIFTYDFWHYPSKNIKFKQQNIFVKSVFKSKNYKIITFLNNIKELNFFHNYNYNQFINNIYFFNQWCCYNKSIIDFNKNPIRKIFISGNCNKINYRERFIMKNIKSNKIFFYKYNWDDRWNNNNKYNLNINKYFAGFSSTISILSQKDNIKYNINYKTNIILLKTFEILGAGSLLIYPKKGEIFLNKIGLFHNKNCYLIDFRKNINQQINYIFNNYNFYNNIRKEGYIFAKNNFNSQKKFEEFCKITNLDFIKSTS